MKLGVKNDKINVLSLTGIITLDTNNVQPSPEGEVNSGGCILRGKAWRYKIIHRSSLNLRGIVVLVFTKSDG